MLKIAIALTFAAIIAAVLYFSGILKYLIDYHDAVKTVKQFTRHIREKEDQARGPHRKLLKKLKKLKNKDEKDLMVLAETDLDVLIDRLSLDNVRLFRLDEDGNLSLLKNGDSAEMSEIVSVMEAHEVSFVLFPKDPLTMALWFEYLEKAIGKKAEPQTA